MVLAQPVERVREQEVAHLVAPVVEDERAPVGMRAAARVLVLVQRRAVEPRERPLVAREVRGHPVEDHADLLPVELVDERTEVVRVAEARGRREVAGHLVAPRAAVRMLHHRQELDVREAEVLRVGAELRGELAVVERLVVERAAPRAEMHLVDRHRAGVRLGAAATLDPLVVAPLVARAEDARRVARRLLGGERVRIGLEQQRAVARRDLEAVERALGGVGHDGLPDAGHAALLHRVRAAVPVVPLADDRHLRRVRRPDRERDALVGDVRAELLVDALVPALADEVQVDVADAGAHARAAASSMRRIPATGMWIQSGRLFSS